MTATPSNSGIFIVPDNVVSDSMKFVNFLIAKYKADDNSIENVLVDISNSGYYALKNCMESFKITEHYSEANLNNES